MYSIRLFIATSFLKFKSIPSILRCKNNNVWSRKIFFGLCSAPSSRRPAWSQERLFCFFMLISLWLINSSHTTGIYLMIIFWHERKTGSQSSKTSLGLLRPNYISFWTVRGSHNQALFLFCFVSVDNCIISKMSYKSFPKTKALGPEFAWISKIYLGKFKAYVRAGVNAKSACRLVRLGSQLAV